MTHPIYRVCSFAKLAPYTLRIRFDDETERIIDFRSILVGEIYGSLRDPALFDQVQIDLEVCILVWLNGADFDPEILHDWPERKAAMMAAAVQWRRYSPGYRKVNQRAEEGMLPVIWYVIIGFIAGAIANFIMHTHTRFIMTTLLGIVGSIVGGLIARSFSVRSKTLAQHGGIYATCAAILGAILVTLVITSLWH